MDPVGWLKRASRRLPPARWADWAVSLPLFLMDHRRLPIAPGRRYEDMLFRLKMWGLLDPRRAVLADKVAAKDHIRRVLGRDPCPETLAVFRRPEEIAPETVPVPCILKATHMSGRVQLAETPLTEAELAGVRAWLGQDYYQWSRERCYLGMEPGVIAERLVADPREVVDVKLFVLEGRARMIKLIGDRFAGAKRYAMLYRDWSPVEGGPPPAEMVGSPPPQLPEMLADAERLAEGFDFLRVDYLMAGGEVWLGELTNLPDGGRLGRPPGFERTANRALFGR